MGKETRQQQVRSLVTRERLIAATLDEILEVGYHTATTQEIAARAGVSRGALLHHFPARSDLILAAMAALLEDGTDQIRAVTASVKSGEVSIEEFLDFVWRLFSGRFFYLSLEMITEARHDAVLRDPMIPIVKRFHDELDVLWSEFCDPSMRSGREAGIILNMTLCLMRGMGVQSVLRPEPSYYRDLLTAWKRLLPELIKGGAGDVVFCKGG
jgi:AcrR family transcriptional regulator